LIGSIKEGNQTLKNAKQNACKNAGVKVAKNDIYLTLNFFQLFIL